MRKVDFRKLNEPQRKAVTFGEGPVLVLAGPGSGKTFTIVNRILCLLERGVPPEEILVITFTRDAARSMQRRFQEMSGELSCPVNFGTFHSCFYHILLESGAIGGKGILKNSEKKALLLPILRQFTDKRQGRRHLAADTPVENKTMDDLGEDAEKILSALSFYKNTLRYEESLKRVPLRWQSCFQAIGESYGRSVRGAGKIDFDDMLCECNRLLRENAEVRRYWQERFSHILIDEFQDINPVQFQVLELLTREPFNIFAVGDDDQAIYGFRGAEPDCMRRFAERFGAKRLLLDVNYRSGQEIVQASLKVVRENRNRFEKQLWADREEGAVVRRKFEGRKEQYEAVISELEESLKSGDSCAVLFRTNFLMQGFAARLGCAGLPYEIREKAASIYEHFIVKDLTAYLEMANGGTSRESFLRIVNKPSRYVSREAVAECGADIERLKRYYGRKTMTAVCGREVVEGLSALERQLRMMSRLSLRLAVEFCLRAVGYERYLREKAASFGEEKWQEWQELLEWLKEDVSQYGSLSRWQEARRACEAACGQKRVQRKGIEEREEIGRTQNVIRLMTVHGAKGLEFDRVWIPDCNETVFPHGALPDGKTVEEERRIFYVAMTRAKKYLELLYLTGTEERPRQPSRFLHPLVGIPTDRD